MTLSPQLTKLFLNLRLAAILVFPFGLFLSAVMQRSVLMVGALALGMVISNRLEQVRFQHAVGALEKMRAAQKFKMDGVISGLLVRAAILAGLFILLIGIMALFRDTSLARGFGWVDLWLWLGLTGFAIAANEISARMVQEHASGAIQTLRTAMNPEPDPAQMDGEIIEGEIIDDGDRL